MSSIVGLDLTRNLSYFSVRNCADLLGHDSFRIRG